MRFGNRVRRMLFGSPVYAIIRPVKQRKDHLLWQIQGKAGPPPFLIKKKVVFEHAEIKRIDTLIETGTYLGDMVQAGLDRFSRIISIELDKNLAHAAQKRFRRNPNVRIFHGDSGDILSEIIKIFDCPCLFWLDAHFSGGISARGKSNTPVMKEIHHILGRRDQNHVILIDDAHCFIGKNGYPKIAELQQAISEIRPEYSLEIKENIIRIQNKLDQHT